jgi:hypothetical protein
MQTNDRSLGAGNGGEHESGSRLSSILRGSQSMLLVPDELLDVVTNDG